MSSRDVKKIPGYSRNPASAEYPLTSFDNWRMKRQRWGGECPGA